MQFQGFAVWLDILSRMRISIATRIFLALTLVSLVILTLNVAVTRWNFERGFLQYVADQEAATIADTAVELAGIYALEGNWSALRDNRRPTLLNWAVASHCSTQTAG